MNFYQLPNMCGVTSVMSGLSDATVISYIKQLMAVTTETKVITFIQPVLGVWSVS